MMRGSNVSDKIQLNTKSSAQLSKEVRNILDQDIPDPSGGMASVMGGPQTRPREETAHEHTQPHG
tara:strand:- start:400 stop:594 length:195 start_codon:yes stop_codon:yes gene_type:complete